MAAPKKLKINFSGLKDALYNAYEKKHPKLPKPTFQHLADHIGVPRSTLVQACQNDSATLDVTKDLVSWLNVADLPLFIKDPGQVKLLLGHCGIMENKNVASSVEETLLVRNRRPDVGPLDSLKPYPMKFLGHSPNSDKSDARWLAEMANAYPFKEGKVFVSGRDAALSDIRNLQDIALIEESYKKLAAQRPIVGWISPKERLQRARTDEALFAAIDECILALHDREWLLLGCFDFYLTYTNYHTRDISVELHIYLYANHGPLPEEDGRFLNRKDWFAAGFYKPNPVDRERFGDWDFDPEDCHYLEEYGLTEIAEDLALGKYDRNLFDRLFTGIKDDEKQRRGNLITE